MKCARKCCSLEHRFFIGIGKTPYCEKHAKFIRIIDSCRTRYNQHFSIQEIEELFDKYFPDKNILCPNCNKKMIWHKSDGKYGDVISIQHWNNNELGFLCMDCNSRHGTSTNKNVLSLDRKNKKYCYKCKIEKNKLDFYLCNGSYDGLQKKCKMCCSVYYKNRKEVIKT